jgi:hypothetical protein
MKALEPDPQGGGWRVLLPVAVAGAAGIGVAAARLRVGSWGQRIAGGSVLGLVLLAAAPALLLNRAVAAALLVSAAAAGMSSAGAPSDRPRSTRSTTVAWLGLAVAGALGVLLLAELAWVTPGNLPIAMQLGRRMVGWTAAAPLAPVWWAAGVAIAAVGVHRWRRASRTSMIALLAPTLAGAGVLMLSSERGWLLDPSMLAALAATPLAARALTAGLAPEQTILRWCLPLAAVLALHVPVVAWNQLWPCSSVAESASLTRLSADPDAFDLAVSGDGRWLMATLRDSRRVIAMDLEHGGQVELDDAQTTATLSAAVGAEVWGMVPENIETFAEGQTLAWLYVVLGPSEVVGAAAPDRPVLAQLEASVGGLRVVKAWDLESCWPAGLDADPRSGTAIVACEEEPELQVLSLGPEPAIRRVRLESAGALERLEPAGPGELYAVSLWGAPELATIRIRDGKRLARTRTGGFNWDLAVHPGRGRVFLPRFLEGHVIEVDPAGASDTRTLPGGFGMRGVEVDVEGDRLFAVSGYDGRLWMHDLAGARPPRRVTVGTLARALLWDAPSRRLFVGGECGVFEVAVDGEGDAR